MQKMTLLEMVQNIASALETDEILSISDTVESLAIAEVIKETFYELFSNTDTPDLQGLSQLEDMPSPGSPNCLMIPADVNKLTWIKYKDFKTGDFFSLSYVTPRDFITLGLSNLASNDPVNLLDTVDPVSGIAYKVFNNKPPSFYTIFNDKYVAFDSVDTDYEAKLNAVNSIAYVQKDVLFSLTDSYVPPLDANMFPLLLAEAKSVCFTNIKQVAAPKEEQRVRRQRRKMQREKFRSRVQQKDYISGHANYARNR